MTAVKHADAPVTTESVRPDWVTDEVLDRLTGRVFRDPGNRSDPLHPVAPYDGQVTATIPTSTADDVTRPWPRHVSAPPPGVRARTPTAPR